jgi:copper(I)-binding protein
MRNIVAVITLAIGLSAIGSATAGASGIAAEHAWARATPKGATVGAAYVTLVNNGSDDDRLVGASSPTADAVQFHSETNDDGVMKMARLAALDVRPGTPVVFKPGSIHIMLLGLKQQLREGESIPLTLSFEKAGPLSVTARVGKIGAMDLPDADSNNGE